MGTRVTHFNYYGWFDGTNNYVYITLCSFDSSKAKEEYKKIIKESYDYAINNPLVFSDYMFRKTSSIWMDPIFDVLYFTGFNRIKNSFVSDFLYYGSGKQLLKILSDIYQSAIYLLCLARLIELFRNIKETKIEELLLYIIIYGGFLFHLFWEASSRYTLPYFFISIMCAAEGLHFVYNSSLNKRVKS